MNYLRQFILIFNYICMAYTLLIDFIFLVQIVISFIMLNKNNKKKPSADYERYFDSENMIPISIIVPAHNEETNIVMHLTELMTLNYPEYELIIVNDGSTDDTHNRIINHFGLYEIDFPMKISIETKEVKAIYFNTEYPNLIYIDKENGGKSDALNAGLNVSQYPIFACLDADSVLERDSLIKLAMTFMKDTNTIASGGIVRIANGSVIKNGIWESFELPRKIVSTFQIIEYFRSFLFGRVSWNISNSLLIISGAFGVFNKSAVINSGGYKTNTIGEDMEIVVRLHDYMRKNKLPYRIYFSSDPVCWTQGPSTLGDLRNQRRRWQIGLMDTLLHYKRMIFNPRYGITGMISVPYNWLFELFGPALEVAGYIIIPLSFFFGELSLFFFVMYLVLANLLGIIISIGGIILEQLAYPRYIKLKQSLSLTFYAIIENFGFRQLLTIFRLEGMLRYRGLRREWGKIKRTEFNKSIR